MASKPSKTSLIADNLRRVARVWSVLVLLLALILLIGTRNAPPASMPINAPPDVLPPVSLLISLAGLVIAWRWEGLGALINIGFYLAILPLYWGLHHEWINLAIMIGLSPVILPGVLFALAWLLSKKDQR